MWWLQLLKVLAVIGAYGAGVEPRFVVRHDEPGVIPNLPAEWEGKQVAVFADLQVGMWWANTDAARRLVRRVLDLRPAIVLIAGDFVYGADGTVDQQMVEVVDILQPLLDAKLPIYAVLGNHDYALMNEHSEQENQIAREVRVALERVGVHMMDNRVVALPSPAGDSAASRPLYLAGIGEKWAKNDHVEETMAKVPESEPRLVFMHDPDSFARIPAGQSPLGIAAHTHGMQLGIPYLSDFLWRHYFSDTGSGVEGWVERADAQGNHLYVNRGVGFSVIPVRLNAVPELTVFTLTGKP